MHPFDIGAQYTCTQAYPGLGPSKLAGAQVKFSVVRDYE